MKILCRDKREEALLADLEETQYDSITKFLHTRPIHDLCSGRCLGLIYFRQRNARTMINRNTNSVYPY